MAHILFSCLSSPLCFLLIYSIFNDPLYKYEKVSTSVCVLLSDRLSAESQTQLLVVKGLEDVEVCESEGCSFEVTLNLSYIDGTWTKDGVKLKSKPTCRITTHWNKHTLTFTRVTVGDTGLFSFQTDGAQSCIQTSGQLIVIGNIMTGHNRGVMQSTGTIV